LKDTFLTPAAPATGEYKDRGSKFIAYAFPVESESDWHARLEEVRKEHPKARHYCFAFRLGNDGMQYRANDDGEPAGSAGRPILGQIDSFGLTNVFVVVVRYFGGTLLGVPGLIAAYKGSTQAALQQAEIVEKIITQSFRVQFDYGLMSQVMNAVKKLSFELGSQEFGETTATIEMHIRKSEAEQKILEFKALAGNLHLEEAAVLEEVPGLRIEFL
jgi:uncharacterized YigZ family protein